MKNQQQKSSHSGNILDDEYEGEIAIEYRTREIFGLEKLLFDLFVNNTYNKFVRPVDENKLTNIRTQLKLLQIDLVSIDC